jgi:predicted secreted protein
MQLTCQILMIIGFLINLFNNLHQVTEGRKALEPTGFSGVCAIIIITSISAFIMFGAFYWNVIFVK